MNHRDTETRSFDDKERMVDEFAEEVWDAVCRLRVGSGLSTKDVIQALKRVEVLVRLVEDVE